MTNMMLNRKREEDCIDQNQNMAVLTDVSLHGITNPIIIIIISHIQKGINRMIVSIL